MIRSDGRRSRSKPYVSSILLLTVVACAFDGSGTGPESAATNEPEYPTGVGNGGDSASGTGGESTGNAGGATASGTSTSGGTAAQQGGAPSTSAGGTSATVTAMGGSASGGTGAGGKAGSPTQSGGGGVGGEFTKAGQPGIVGGSPSSGGMGAEGGVATGGTAQTGGWGGAGGTYPSTPCPSGIATGDSCRPTQDTWCSRLNSSVGNPRVCQCQADGSWTCTAITLPASGGTWGFGSSS